MGRSCAGCLGVAILCAVVRSNAQEANRFEVASVTRNVSVDVGTVLDMSRGQMRATNLPVRALIRQAFDVMDSQIVDAPSWVTDERYDVVAKAPEGVVTFPAMRPLLRTLLSERFKLATHIESREMPVFGLTRPASSRRNTPGLREASRDCATGAGAPPANPTDEWPMCAVSFRPGLLYVGGYRMSVVARQLATLAERPVLDETAISAPVQFRLEYQPAGRGAPSPDPANDRPEFFTALEEQAGLKLVSKRAPVDVLVVDSVQRPSAD